LLLSHRQQRHQVPLACSGHTAQPRRLACAAPWACSTRVPLPPPPSPPHMPYDRSTPLGLAPLQVETKQRLLPFFELWGRLGMSQLAPSFYAFWANSEAKMQITRWTSPLHHTSSLPPLSLVPADGLFLYSWTTALELGCKLQHGGACDILLGAASCMPAPEPPSENQPEPPIPPPAACQAQPLVDRHLSHAILSTLVLCYLPWQSTCKHGGWHTSMGLVHRPSHSLRHSHRLSAGRSTKC
jgi:hypothetical protein